MIRSYYYILAVLILAASAGCSRFSGSSSGNASPGVPTCPTVNQQGFCAKCGNELDLNWTIPTQNTDGSPTTLTGFDVYYGPDSSLANVVNISDPTQSTYSMMNLTPGTYYLGVTATAAPSGTFVQSAMSNVIAVNLSACTRVSVDTASGKIKIESIPPKIIDMKNSAR